MKKFFGTIANGIKKLFSVIGKAFKKLFQLITNKWLLKSTTTVILVALVIACYAVLNWGVKQIEIADLDFTTKKLYSLSKQTRDRLSKLDEDVTIQLINFSQYTYLVEYVDKYKIERKRI